MADVLLNIEEASKQLQLSKDQIAEMVKKGLLRGFLDQKTYKFRPADIEAFKKKLASGATALSEGAPKTDAVPGGGHATSKIDLTEVESDSGVEDTDQTSVLAPVKSGEPKEKQPEKPVFKFGEKDLELHEEEPAALEEGDQTSLLVPGAGKEEKGKSEVKPPFEFAEKDVKLPSEGEAGDSVLVADESESSMDILEVAEESSSESASSASRIAVLRRSHLRRGDRGGCGNSLASSGRSRRRSPRRKRASRRPTRSSPTSSAPPRRRATRRSKRSTWTKWLRRKSRSARKPTSSRRPPPRRRSPTSTRPSASRPRRKPGPPWARRLRPAAWMERSRRPFRNRPPRKSPRRRRPKRRRRKMVPTGWETAQAWPIGNGLLIAATVVLIVAGALLFCEAFDVHNGFTAEIAKMVQGHAALK